MSPNLRTLGRRENGHEHIGTPAKGNLTPSGVQGLEGRGGGGEGLRGGGSLCVHIYIHHHDEMAKAIAGVGLYLKTLPFGQQHVRPLKGGEAISWKLVASL